MSYNYNQEPFFANLVGTGLVIDGTETQNLVIEKKYWVEEQTEEDSKWTLKTEIWTYDATGLTIPEVDALTRQKIAEING